MYMVVKVSFESIRTVRVNTVCAYPGCRGIDDQRNHDCYVFTVWQCVASAVHYLSGASMKGVSTISAFV